METTSQENKIFDIPNDIVVHDHHDNDVSVLGEDSVEQVWRNELMKDLKPPTEEDVAAMKARDSPNNSVPEANDVMPSSVSTLEESAFDPISDLLKKAGHSHPVLFVTESESAAAVAAATSNKTQQMSEVQGFNEGGNFASFSSSPESWMVLKSPQVYSKAADGVQYFSIEGLNAYVVDTACGKIICLNDVAIPLSSFLQLRRTKTIWKSRTEKTGSNLPSASHMLDQNVGTKLFFKDKEPPVFVQGADCHSIVMLAKHIHGSYPVNTYVNTIKLEKVEEIDVNACVMFMATIGIFFLGVVLSVLVSR
jgi:hypothetical protein